MKIHVRPDPTRPSANRDTISDPRVPKTGEATVDLSPFRGSLVRMTVEGVAQATNIATSNVERLAAIGLFGPGVETPSDEVDHDPAFTRGDLFARWAGGLPKPTLLEEFDVIYEARSLLHLAAGTAHPAHIVEGAFEFLDAYGMAAPKELQKIVHIGVEKSDPTRKIFVQLLTRQRSRTMKSTLSRLARALPPSVATLRGTALEPGMDGLLAEPDEKTMGPLLAMGPLRTCAAIHVLRLTARVASEGYIRRRVYLLGAIDAEITSKQNGVARTEAATAVLLELLERAGHRDTQSGRLAEGMLEAWWIMTGDLDIAVAREGAEVREELSWPSRVLQAELTNFRKNRDRRQRRSAGKKRLETSSSLADNLPSITMALDLRYREVEKLHTAYQSGRERLEANPQLASLPIVHEWHEVDNAGLPTGGMVPHEFRLWRSKGLLDELVAASSVPVKEMPYVLAQAAGGRYPAGLSEATLEYVENPGRDRPWFVEFYAADVMGGSQRLDQAIRRKRYEVVSALDLPVTQTHPTGLLTFSEGNRGLFRTALNVGRVLVPIEELKIALQIAHTVLNLGLVTAARAGEILQIRMDGANFHHDPESGLAFWKAEPKQPPDRADPVPLIRDYHLDEHVMSQVLVLRDDMRKFLGPARAAETMAPCQVLGKLQPAPWLFRLKAAMLTPGHLKTLLRYLAAGIAVFGVHDIRAAVAKHRLDRGDGIGEIASLLGHRQRAQTKGYARPTKQMSDRKQTDRREWTAEERRLRRLDKIRSRAG